MSVLAGDDGRLRLDVFEGPLDLLLYLIRKAEIDIHDIPIAEVTAEYQAMLERAIAEGVLDLDFAGDYFLLAATLIQVKTRMLLPRTPDPVTGEAPEDPRRALVEQLLEHERFREAAMLLRERGDMAETLATRPEEAVRHWYGGETVLDADLLALARAFEKILMERRARTPHVLAPARFTVRDRMAHVLGLLRRPREGTAEVAFTSLFADGAVDEIVATFLAVLELVKRCFLRVDQRDRGGEIWLSLVPESERPADEILTESEFDAVPAPVDEGSEGGDVEEDGEEEEGGLTDELGGDADPSDGPASDRRTRPGAGRRTP